MVSTCVSQRSTIVGLLVCQSPHQGDCQPGHYHDHVEGGRFVSRFEWYDGVSGYGSMPPSRLRGPHGPPPTDEEIDNRRQ